MSLSLGRSWEGISLIDLKSIVLFSYLIMPYTEKVLKTFQLFGKNNTKKTASAGKEEDGKDNTEGLNYFFL